MAIAKIAHMKLDTRLSERVPTDEFERCCGFHSLDDKERFGTL